MQHVFTGVGPVVLAHRGGAAEVAENTTAAAAHAAALGVVMETDARLTADGEVVLFHDPDLSRTTGADGTVEELTWEQIGGLEVDGGGSPARLVDVLASHSHLRLNVDAKTDEVVEPLIGVLSDSGASARVCVASFSGDRLVRVREALPVATSLSPWEIGRLRLASAVPGPLRRSLAAKVPGPDDGAVAVQVPELYRGLPLLTPRFIAVAHDRGLQVHAWTVNETEGMERLLDLGVDGIVTDRPTALIEVLAARGPWH
jgi:glycerophosphoryl diester phosphodiesterase